MSNRPQYQGIEDVRTLELARQYTDSHGTTSERPAAPNLSQKFIDTTINKIIWWDGTAWRDAMGTLV